MIRTDVAISRLRRDLVIATVLRWVLLVGLVVAVLIQWAQVPMAGSLMLGVILVIWIVLSYQSAQATQLTAEVPMLIAEGEFERAESQIDVALRAFSIYRATKLRVLHQLTMLRHAQRRHAEAVLLGRALLGERLGALSGLSKSTRLVLADSMLELGDVRGAHLSLASLYIERLTLGEALELTAIQTEYLVRIGAWQDLAAGMRQKLELAELMPSGRSALLHALLALAARKTGKTQWEQHLCRRAELLADVSELVAIRPVLGELWTAEGERKMQGEQ